MGEKIDVLSALGITTDKIKLWTRQRLNDMNSKIADGFSVSDGKLYLSKDGEVISDGIDLPSGGGGGGSTGSVAVKNLLNSNTLTVATGQSVNLKFSFISSETEDDGTVYIYVDNVLKGTSVIVSGKNDIDISSYVKEGTNEVKITCMDIYSNSRSLLYTVNVVNLKITSTFDSNQIYSNDINVRYIPYGAVEKQVHFILDDTEDIVTTSETGKQQTYTIPMMPHGVHTLKIYITATINSDEIRSNELNYDIMCVTDNVTTPLIASSYNVTSVTQGELINIPFIVYDPVVMETEVALTIKQDDDVYFTSSQTVDRTLQHWTTRNYPVGKVVFTITYGSISKSHIIEVKENDINVSIKETDLEFYLNAAGRSNKDNNRDVWSNNGVDTTFEYINWDSTGWVNDENGDTALRLSGNAKAIINFMPFNTDARQTGKTIEMCFAIRDVNNRDAVAISCMSDGIGFSITADTAKITSEQTEVFCNYTDEEKISIAFVIEPRSEYRMMSVYLNGVLSGVKQYPETDNIQQNPTVNISIGSPYCSVDLYTIRSYNMALTEGEIRDNYIADITDIGDKLALYTDNNIYDSFGQLSFSALQSKIPILVITGDLPTYKGDKKKVSVSFTHPDKPMLNYEDSATIDVQGTSSQFYIRKNWKIKCTTEHLIDTDQIETKVFCWKADYAESTGSHNTGSANYVHTLYGDYKVPPQEIDGRVRTSIYGYPAVIFHKKDSNATPEFLGRIFAQVKLSLIYGGNCADSNALEG